MPSQFRKINCIFFLTIAILYIVQLELLERNLDIQTTAGREVSAFYGFPTLAFIGATALFLRLYPHMSKTKAFKMGYLSMFVLAAIVCMVYGFSRYTIEYNAFIVWVFHVLVEIIIVVWMSMYVLLESHSN